MAIEWINEKDLQEIRDEEKLNPPGGGVVDEETLQKIAEIDILTERQEMTESALAELMMMIPILTGGGEV